MKMMNEPFKTLHPMNIKGILDQALQLYRSNFLKFIGIIILAKGPYLVLESFLVELIESYTAGTSYSPGPNIFLVRLLEPLFIIPLLTAAMTIAISHRLLDREIGITEAYSKLLKTLSPLLGTILLSGIVIGAGFMFFVIPGIFLWIWFAFIPQTVIFDGEGGVSAMKRSKHLVKGFFGKTFILLVLLFLAASLITEMISYGITRFLPSALGIGAANVVSVLIEPFKISAMMLLYYDLRIRKEGFDLEIMAEELEAGMDDDYPI
ncbi:hypothetical protein ACFL6S_37495 [Candidatus Poribacteria bacterium]